MSANSLNFVYAVGNYKVYTANEHAGRRNAGMKRAFVSFCGDKKQGEYSVKSFMGDNSETEAVKAAIELSREKPNG